MEIWISAFRTALDKAHIALRAIPADRLSRRMRPDGWNMHQLLGHLIDSACNNHRRFTLAARQDHLRFEGYAQEAWVEINAYDKRDWLELVQLWYSFNLQICHLMAQFSEEKLNTPTTAHYLDRMAWEQIATGEPATLGYFMRDYIGHCEHHLAQIQDITQ